MLAVLLLVATAGSGSRSGRARRTRVGRPRRPHGRAGAAGRAAARRRTLRRPAAWPSRTCRCRRAAAPTSTVLPRRPAADRAGVRDRQPVPAAEPGDRAPRDPVPGRPGRRGRRPRRSTPQTPATAGPASAAPASRSGGDRLGAARLGGWVAAWAPGGERDAARRRDRLPGRRPAARSSCRSTTTCWPPAARPAGTDQSGVRLRLRRRRRPTCAAADHAAAGADRAAVRRRPSPARCATGPRPIADVADRFGPARPADGGPAELLCNGGRRPPRRDRPSTATRPVRQARPVYAVAGHMHLLGRSIKVELNPGTPRRAARCWTCRSTTSTTRRPAAGRSRSRCKPGDMLRVTCTHDATLRGQLPELQAAASPDTSCGATAPATRCASASSSGPAPERVLGICTGGA